MPELMRVPASLGHALQGRLTPDIIAIVRQDFTARGVLFSDHDPAALVDARNRAATEQLEALAQEVGI